MMNCLRVATYNVHKCRGFDRKTSPERIIEVIKELDVDVIFLQEVVNAPGGLSVFDQADQISKALSEYTSCFGANRSFRGGTYGNMTLTRLPLIGWKNHDLTRASREERGVLQTDIDLGDKMTLHAFNVHLGTSFTERRYQARQLLGPEILAQPVLHGPRLVIGDFNEWTEGLTTKLLRSTFQSFRPQHAWPLKHTFPGMLPLMTLDHCYYEPPLVLVGTQLWRNRRALVASDHLPLIAEFCVDESC